MNFWKDKIVLITGHTGFKGSWLSLYLKEMGANVFGYALKPKSKSMFNAIALDYEVKSFFGDIRNFNQLLDCVNAVKPEILFHLAAQPLVTESYLKPIETIETNILGSSNVLMIANSVKSVKAVINVTTDKCYENREWHWPYRENDRLGGIDPYSASKACVEILNNSIYKSFYKNNNIGLASVRAGNVIGGGDWGNDRLVPDILDAIEDEREIVLRCPKSIRPWQHVMEPLSGYVSLAQKLFRDPQNFSEPFNFGPRIENVVPVEELVKQICTLFDREHNYLFQQGIILHEAQTLNLDSSKAHKRLNWFPKWSLEQTCQSLFDWHNAHYGGQNMNLLTKQQISRFLKS